MFIVPLERGGAARGVVARTASEGRLLFGYFFGPRLPSKAKADLAGLEPGNAVLRLRFGDLGLLKGLWPVIGKLPDWNPAKWPMSSAVRRDPLGIRRPVLVRYDDNDPSKVLSEEILENDNDLPSDGLAGYGFVEAKLSKMLV
ncbi:hypothetical protein JQ575_26770 [Bradyrhizobium sp. JYMT SZCCT0428]|nr:hypothetical protein [Bradyrhizobium sp. JYMT SZCCT0428]